ncbi:MAG: ribosome assembly cofactor RimP [Spirochaetaceae bacterium]|jgi:ribosome maturation factor RimP|nr:ribosome assembly cofactor RimP [Spirochaetaceae bacterium]
MLWKKERKDGGAELELALEPVAKGLGLSLVELIVSRHRGTVHVRAVVFKREGVGIDDCSRFHRAITPRLELAFGEAELSIEVSSPGIDRLIRDGAEFVHYIGCPIKWYNVELADWSYGIVERVTETFIEIKGIDRMETLTYERIAKAKLDSKAAE